MRSIRLEPCVELHQGLGPKAIQTPLGVAPHVDQARIAQHLEMAGHTGLMHPDLLDEIGHRAFGIANRVEDSPPRRFGDHGEDFQRGRHGRNIRYTVYMCQQIYVNVIDRQTDALLEPAS